MGLGWRNLVAKRRGHSMTSSSFFARRVFFRRRAVLCNLPTFCHFFFETLCNLPIAIIPQLCYNNNAKRGTSCGEINLQGMESRNLVYNKRTETKALGRKVSEIRKIVANIFQKPLDKHYIVWYNISVKVRYTQWQEKSSVKTAPIIGQIWMAKSPTVIISIMMDMRPAKLMIRKGKQKMIKCPNCGSTAQVTLIKKEVRHDDWEWDEEYKCGCGCTIETRVQVREKITRYKGTLIDYEHHH